MTVQLPAESFAETKACLDARVRNIPSDGEVPLDQRRCDAFMDVIRSATPGGNGRATTASPFFVVAHVPLAGLVDASGESTALAAELEHDGLIDTETVQRIACDATIAAGGGRRRWAHHVRGTGAKIPDSGPTPRSNTAGPTLSVPGLHQRDVHQCASHRSVEGAGRTDLENLALLVGTTTEWCTVKVG